MGLKVLDAYIPEHGVCYIIVSKEIVAIQAKDLCRDIEKLKKAYDKAFKRMQEKGLVLSGVVLAGNILINLMDDGTFDGIIWSSKQRLSGKYTLQ